VPGFTPSALSAFGVAEGQTSPLVLDLDGVELTDHDGAIEDILFTWAGVDGIATDSRGPYIDARRLEFLEECFDAEWQQYGYLPDPEVNAAAQLEVSWDIVFTAMKAALLLQSGADELFADALTYDAWSGEIVGDPELDEDAVGDLADVAPAPGTANEAFWMAVARFIDDVQGLGELTGTEEGWLDDAVQASDATLTWEDVLDLLEASEPPVNYDDTSGNDVMTGSAGANSMRGFEGDDEISGLGGADVIDGGADWDTVRYTRSASGVTVNLATNVNMGGDAAGDLLSNVEAVTGSSHNDTLTGGSGSDVLYGEAGNDTLPGNANNDILYGRSGLDTLTGGDGSDTFVFEAASPFGNVDVMTDFSTGQSDKLDLSDLLSAYDSLTEDITHFVEITTSGSNSLLKVDMDGTGAGASFVQIATLQGITGLTDEAALEANGTLITA
jgi:Ca2+-binding RTX toxin-like protein